MLSLKFDAETINKHMLSRLLHFYAKKKLRTKNLQSESKSGGQY